MKKDYPPMDEDHFGPKHPFMRKGTHHPGMRPFGRRKHLMYHLELFNELETKDDAIDFMELQKKRIAKRQEYLSKKIKRLGNIEDLMEEKIKEIVKMEDYTSDKMKKIINGIRLERIKQRLELDE
ncbi:MAG TPA: hypothetical protein VMX55_09475 [candidate division Zixibacteria bacterium]|nr:hypothetical protein [candidate division Zixibacteria bacterium]